ncbi:peptidase U32 family protein [Marinicrinis sediminis]|uniref:Peptidase U32 family protein n=1 Tax=Marinicrinis sediminis TaxID=1652465 RepID=A0ABW5R5R8_9BACL
MRKKPELLATADSLTQIDEVIQAGADAVNIGENRFGMRMPGNFRMEDMQAGIARIHQGGARAYISVNQIFSNDMLEDVKAYVANLHQWGADALVFGDPAILMILKELSIEMDLHWNTEMTATNYATAKYWQSKGASRVILARELNLEEIHEVKRMLPDMDVQVQIHGMTNMYHSKRNLLQNYMAHQGKEASLSEFGQERGLYLIEEERQELHVPVFEDEGGTHMMSPDDICLMEALDELFEVDLDSVKIDGLLKTPAYHVATVESYRAAIDAYYANPEAYVLQPEWIARIQALQDPNRELTFGFLFKEQVY